MDCIVIIFSPVEAVLEDVVGHSLICPRVVQGRGQVKLPVEEDEHGPVEARCDQKVRS